MNYEEQYKKETGDSPIHYIEGRAYEWNYVEWLTARLSRAEEERDKIGNDVVSLEDALKIARAERDRYKRERDKFEGLLNAFREGWEPIEEGDK